MGKLVIVIVLVMGLRGTQRYGTGHSLYPIARVPMAIDPSPSFNTVGSL
jgi:hypothetical protein